MIVKLVVTFSVAAWQHRTISIWSTKLKSFIVLTRVHVLYVINVCVHKRKLTTYRYPTCLPYFSVYLKLNANNWLFVTSIYAGCLHYFDILRLSLSNQRLSTLRMHCFISLPWQKVGGEKILSEWSNIINS